MSEQQIISDPHPEVVRWSVDAEWPADKPFPLTPLEAWYILQSYVVKPAGGLTREQFFDLPGRLEGAADGLQLRFRPGRNASPADNPRGGRAQVRHPRGMTPGPAELCHPP